MKITITNPKSSKFNMIVFEMLEHAAGYSDYSDSHLLKPGERVRVPIDDDHGVKVEKLGRDDEIQPR